MLMPRTKHDKSLRMRDIARKCRFSASREEIDFHELAIAVHTVQSASGPKPVPAHSNAPSTRARRIAPELARTPAHPSSPTFDHGFLVCKAPNATLRLASRLKGLLRKSRRSYGTGGNN